MDIDPGCSNTQLNNPSCQTQTNNNPTSQPNKRQKRKPIHFVELTKDPTASLPKVSEPLQPGETAATKKWHYKHNNAAFFGNVKACM
jgi:cell division protein FtsN